MPSAMLDYTKLVLQKVSFDTMLFAKEVQKALRVLLPSEIKELEIWLVSFLSDKPDLQPSLVYLK